LALQAPVVGRPAVKVPKLVYDPVVAIAVYKIALDVDSPPAANARVLDEAEPKPNPHEPAMPPKLVKTPVVAKVIVVVKPLNWYNPIVDDPQADTPLLWSWGLVPPQFVAAPPLAMVM
jgi:hypothetical protein